VPAPTSAPLANPPTNKLYFALAFGYAALSAGLGANGALVKLRDELDFSSTIVGLHGAAFGVCLLLLGLRGPWLVGRLGERKAFVLAIALIAGGTLLYASAYRVGQSLTGAGAIGFGSALLVVLIPATVDRMYADDKAQVFSSLNAWPSGLGIIQGPLLAVFMSSNIGWRFPLAVWVSVICALATWFGLGSLHHHEATAVRTNPFTLLRSKMVRLATARNAFGVAVEFTFAVFVGTFVRELLDLSTAWATASGALFSIGSTIARAFGPRLLEVFGQRLELACYCGSAASSLLLALPAPLPVRLLAVGTFGAFTGPLYVFGTGRMFHVGNNDPGIAGLGALASGIGITVGPIAVGVLSDLGGWATAAMYFPLLCAIGGLWTFRSQLGAFRDQ
jgi:predicted MFS family arabinose efflux permease